MPVRHKRETYRDAGGFRDDKCGNLFGPAPRKTGTPNQSARAASTPGAWCNSNSALAAGIAVLISSQVVRVTDTPAISKPATVVTLTFPMYQLSDSSMLSTGCQRLHEGQAPSCSVNLYHGVPAKCAGLKDFAQVEYRCVRALPRRSYVIESSISRGATGRRVPRTTSQRLRRRSFRHGLARRKRSATDPLSAARA